MAQLVSLLSVPGFKATSDPQDLAALDVVRKKTNVCINVNV